MQIIRYISYLCSVKQNSMAYRLSNYPDLFTKRSVAKQVFPHLPSRYGWKKIRMAVGDDPVLHAAFVQHRRYLYLSEYKYLMNIL